MRSHAKTYVGTSGWSYAHWKGLFYPEKLPSAQMLHYYIQHFSSAEINASFYRLPEKKTLQKWYDTTPKHFLFTAKGSRFTTHMKKLSEPRASSKKFFNRISTLGDKLGPILFQLPPLWRFNGDRLDRFLKAMSNDFRYAFEFRDHSWFNDDAYAILEKYRAAFCIYDLAGFHSPEIVTTDFIYTRLHGPGAAYQGSYRKPSLMRWARAFKEWNGQGRCVYCYFDNDQKAYAARNAERINTLL